jgi:hypothetical protein
MATEERNCMRLVSIGIITALCSAGCGTTATIHRWGAPPLEAQIVDSDPKSVYVEDDQGNRYRVPRASITELDHPGNVALGIGVGLLAIGSMLYFLDDDSGRESDDEARRTMALGYAIPGAILTAWGGYSWFSSRGSAAHAAVEQAMPVPSVVPVSVADIVLPPGTLPVPGAVAPAKAPLPGTPETFAPGSTPPPGPNP